MCFRMKRSARCSTSSGSTRTTSTRLRRRLRRGVDTVAGMAGLRLLRGRAGVGGKRFRSILAGLIFRILRRADAEVCRFANVLKAAGAAKGTRVTLYMPMIPEAAIAMLACARIGAVHSVVFGGFSPDALAGGSPIADRRSWSPPTRAGAAASACR